MTEQYGIQEIQPIIGQIFPNFEEVPMNSISSSIFGEGENKCIYFLIVGDDKLITPFLEDTKDEAKVKTITKAEKRTSKLYYDLILEFGIYFKGGKATFRTVFQAEQPEIQQTYLDALKEVESFRFLITDQDRKIRKIVEIDWYYFKNKKIIQKIEKMKEIGR